MSARRNLTLAQEFDELWTLYVLRTAKPALSRTACEAIFFAGACSGAKLWSEAPTSDARLRLIQEFKTWADLHDKIGWPDT